MTRKTSDKVARKSYNRVMTPDLDESTRQEIKEYHASLRRQGMTISEGAALLYAAMQTIKAAKQGAAA